MTSSRSLPTACLAMLLLALGFFAGAGPALAGSEIVTAARHGVHGKETRFVLELTGKVSHTLVYQADPDRITIVLPGLRWQPGKTSARATSGLISEYGFRVIDEAHTEIVLELREPAKVKSTMIIPPESGHDWRLVLDLAPAGKTEFQRLAAVKPKAEQPAKIAEKRPEPKTEAKLEPKPQVEAQAPPAPKPAEPKVAAKSETAPPAAKPAPATPPKPVAAPPAADVPGKTALAKVPSEVKPPALPKAVPRRPPEDVPYQPVIVIDPGHGGADPGAQAADGTMEKDVVLEVALVLAKKLERTGRYGVMLTRAADTTLKLRERVELSRSSHGDLFVSLHANYFEKSPAVGGLSVYTLSDRASSEAAAALARKENRADLLAGIDLSHETDDVTHILLDLAQHETLSRSVRFSHRLVETVARSTPLEKNAGQQASLVVLKAPDVPSILVELGYLTNPADLERMKSDIWIDQFADAFIAAADWHFQIKNARRDDRALLR